MDDLELVKRFHQTLFSLDGTRCLGLLAGLSAGSLESESEISDQCSFKSHGSSDLEKVYQGKVNAGLNFSNLFQVKCLCHF